MFKIGSYVMYENEGVCRVMDITPYPYGNQEKGQKLYYQLSPLFKKGATIYVSVHTNAQIRDIMTAKEARFFMEHLALEDGKDDFTLRGIRKIWECNH